MTTKGFDGIRSEMYRKALEIYPDARGDEFSLVEPLLDLQKGQSILEVGSGTSHFRNKLVQLIGPEGRLLITDPSSDQLSDSIPKGPVWGANYNFLYIAAEDLQFEGEFDRVFSMGAFHHINDQTQAMKKVYEALIPGGKAVICDVFQGRGHKFEGGSRARRQR